MLEGPGLVALLDRTFDGYRVTRAIGSGRSGALFEAAEIGTGRRLSMRFFHPYFAADPQFMERFEHEAGALVRLRHPNIVPVLGYGRDENLAYLVLEYVEGESLRDRLEQTRGQTLREALNMAVMLAPQIGNAVSAIHRRGYVHGDIKPSNILLAADGQAYLANVGVASIIVGDQTTGMTIGTPEYMAPEQEATDGAPAISADTYAFAVVLYELLVGRAPFEGPTPSSIMRQHLQEPPPSPHVRHPDFPVHLEQVLMKALAKEPKDRYPDMQSLLGALVVALDAIPLATTAPEPETEPEPVSSAPVVRAAPAIPDAVSSSAGADPVASIDMPEAASHAPEQDETRMASIEVSDAAATEGEVATAPAAVVDPSQPASATAPPAIPPATPAGQPDEPAPSEPLRVRRITASPPPATVPEPVPTPESPEPAVRRISMPKAPAPVTAESAVPARSSSARPARGGRGIGGIISTLLTILIIAGTAAAIYFILFQPSEGPANPTRPGADAQPPSVSAAADDPSARTAGGTAAVAVPEPTALSTPGAPGGEGDGPAVQIGGEWVHNFGTLRLNQAGIQITGSYENGFTQTTGTIEGRLTGTTLTGRWSHDDQSGSLRWEMSTDGRTFTGSFDADTRHRWCGARLDQPFPDGCSFAGAWVNRVHTRSDCPMTLQRTNMAVTGTYCEGTIEGRVSLEPSHDGVRSVLDGTRHQPGREPGALRLYLTGYEAEQFQGYWRGEHANEWCGWRANAGPPEPCLMQ